MTKRLIPLLRLTCPRRTKLRRHIQLRRATRLNKVTPRSLGILHKVIRHNPDIRPKDIQPSLVILQLLVNRHHIQV